jgi:hypothetical protein
MKHILSHRIVKHLAKEERETKERYQYLGKAYKLPKLTKAGAQEGSHAKIFQKLEHKTAFESAHKKNMAWIRGLQRKDGFVRSSKPFSKKAIARADHLKGRR